jgi:hypothetical protein
MGGERSFRRYTAIADIDELFDQIIDELFDQIKAEDFDAVYPTIDPAPRRRSDRMTGPLPFVALLYGPAARCKPKMTIRR